MAIAEMETLTNLTSLDLWPHGPGVSHTVHVLIGIYVCVAGPLHGWWHEDSVPNVKHTVYQDNLLCWMRMIQPDN